MSDARREILARVGAALGHRTADRTRDYLDVPRRYRREAALPIDQRLALFVERLEDYGVDVFACGGDGVAGTVARTIAARGGRRLYVPDALPGEWTPPGIEWVADRGAAYHELDAADGVLTGCTVAIALTGTIVLCHTAVEGRRALTLVPDYHLCVVHASQVVETVPEAFEVLRARRPEVVTTISGPSATADIEMTRVKGVHGPRTLDVVLVAG